VVSGEFNTMNSDRSFQMLWDEYNEWVEDAYYELEEIRNHGSQEEIISYVQRRGVRHRQWTNRKNIT